MMTTNQDDIHFSILFDDNNTEKSLITMIKKSLAHQPIHQRAPLESRYSEWGPRLIPNYIDCTAVKWEKGNSVPNYISTTKIR